MGGRTRRQVHVLSKPLKGRPVSAISVNEILFFFKITVFMPKIILLFFQKPRNTHPILSIFLFFESSLKKKDSGCLFTTI